ncbi:unnamed protein product [Symbiodinium natans]|uniref:Uncharacterized protein n=1 Tax=Symbiodinium natans TaxID=878477 RepID=A0A812HRD3_9DINO|nr:unnamed protein product [Symbiodinium natans]
MDRQVTFAFPPQVFGKRIADTFSDEDDEKLRQRIRSKLDGKVHGEAAVGHIFSLENGGPTCRDNVFMQEYQWNSVAQDLWDELQRAEAAFSAAQKCPDFCEGRWAGWTCEDIRKKGVDEFRRMGLWVREAGGFDARSPAIKRGMVEVLPSGLPVGVHECLRTYSDACWDGESSEEWSPYGEIDFQEAEDFPRIIGAHELQQFLSERPRQQVLEHYASPAGMQRLSVEQPQLSVNRREVQVERGSGGSCPCFECYFM